MNPESALRKCFRDTFGLLRGLPLLVALGLRLGASTYYVDYTAGSNSNAGTSPTAAWKHCPGDAAANGAPAALALAPGDTVIFKGGVAYTFTGTSGIALRWNGVQGSPITYDGNSAGTWGTGRAKFTNNFGNPMTAFTATTAASWLMFKNLEVSAIGGAAALPADTGSAVPARFGGGLSFAAGATSITVDSCVFAQLGYAFNQKPMAATSLAGTAIALHGADAVTITKCDFSRMAVGIDLTGSAVLTNTTISNCTFHDYVAWVLDGPANNNGVLVYGCSDTNNSQFDRAAWTGYGENPRSVAKTVTAGTTVMLTASAAALPAATYQWQLNGNPVSGATGATLTLASVASGSAGTYTVIATNSLGATVSHEVVLTVSGTTAPSTSAPVFTTQPVSQTAAPLSTVTFTVAASGTPTPAYQWFHDGTAIAGATSATLTLTSVSSSSAGSYTAVATNSAGSATSNAATLTISSGGTGTVPVFTVDPVSQTAAPLSKVTFTASASGSPAPTYQWFRNGITFPGWTAATLTLDGLSSNDEGTYVAVATNAAGTATSRTATLSVSTATTTTTTGTAPAITTQPLSQTVTAQSPVSFTVAASGSPTPALQWFKNGNAIAGATAATFTLASVSSTDAATYFAVATNSLGSAQSNGAMLTVNPLPTGIAPVFTLQPVGTTAAPKTTVKFTALASGTPAPTYQWKKDGAAISGATSSTLTLNSVNKGSAGTYTVVAANSAGSVTSSSAVLTISSTNAKIAGLSASNDEPVAASTPVLAESSRLVNLSVRANAGTGDESLIVGFVVHGEASKSLLIRGTGPALRRFGVTGVLVDPTLSLFSGANLLAANDDWSSSADAGAIGPISDRVGAFALTEASQDAALLANVAAGVYTGQISGKQSATGTALIELYDVGTDDAARLVNVSVRTVVRAGGDAPTIGFVVAGNAPKRLLIRAVGPGLAAFGVAGTLADPHLGIYEGETRLLENDDWSGSTELDDAFQRTGAFSLPNSASKDAALIFTAKPGAYTAIVSGMNNASGTVLVEVYELEQQ